MITQKGDLFMRFMDIFKNWANDYDQTVNGNNEEYYDVFYNYNDLISQISKKVYGDVLDIGAGTGNLTELMYKNNDIKNILSIDPSKEMREVAKKDKNIDIEYGHFLDIPTTKKFDFIVASFSFHHLTYKEKDTAFKNMKRHLNTDGRIIILDTLFKDELSKKEIIEKYTKKNYINLVEDLKTEYYPYLEEIDTLLKKNDFQYTITQKNTFAWEIIIENK
ncbi:class I SAM-dependent methyltransferase [Staphylococcus pasteuri]|nr:class I SAM-dependent methyltransferase [Staphylococcus pasteuri]